VQIDEFYSTNKDCPLVYLLTADEAGQLPPDSHLEPSLVIGGGYITIRLKQEYWQVPGNYTFNVIATAFQGRSLSSGLIRLEVECLNTSSEIIAPSNINAVQTFTVGTPKVGFTFPYFTNTVSGCPIYQFSITE